MSDDRYKDPNVLKRLYWDEGLTTYEMADRLGVTDTTIRNWMDEHGIDRRPHNSEKPPYFFTRRQDGYEEVKSKVNGKTHHVLIHRLSAVAEFGVDDVADLHVHHKNGIPWDNRMDNICLMHPEDHGRIHANQRHHGGETNV